MFRSLFGSIVVTILAVAGVSAQGGMGGASTGEQKTYSSRRTVGIVDRSAQPVFENITSQTPLKDFRCVGGSKEKEYIVETTACTVAIFDFDNDGRPDIYLLNGGTMEAASGKAPFPRSALYRNLGNWKFEDVTAKAGVSNERWGMGVATGDYDNDGFTDLFVSNFGAPRLYRNNGNGTFTDVAPKLKLDASGWHTGASFGDINKDGRLDLFVPAYVELDLAKLPQSPVDVARNPAVAGNFCQFRGQPVMCGPRGLRGAKDSFFRQTASGGFEEVGAAVGITDEGNYYGFASVFVDVDNDGDVDLLVVNDSTPKQLYINNGKGTFEEIGYPSGIALNENGREQAGMGLAVGDYDNDGLVDFHITNFSDDSNVLYRNDGETNFADVTFQAGLGEQSIPFLGWGTAFLDFNNDGWQDLLVANGHVYPSVDNFQWGTSFAQQLLLFKNSRTLRGAQIRFERVGAAPGTALAEAFTARGLAVGDLDGDGRVDAVLANIDSAPTILKNVTAPAGNWLSVKLVGDPAKNTPKDGVGSRILVTTGSVTQRFDVISGSSYASQNDQTVHIGLGPALKVDKLEVLWAGGQRQLVSVEGINKRITISQK